MVPMQPVPLQPVPVRHAPRGMVAAIDHLASAAGVDLLRRGGSAVDAAVAASAVLAVTSQHMCGMGGDLWAVVHPGGNHAPVALNASGRAGSGADPGRLKRAGHRTIPSTSDPAAVPIPGCVDGWLALHDRFGRLPLAEVLEPARRYAVDGFPASPDLVAAVALVVDLPDAADYAPSLSPGDLVRRPGVGRALADIAAGGREAFYGGEFGAGLIEIGAGEYSAADLTRPQADWVPALGVDAWGHRLWTVPPNSQGYLTLAAAWIADGLDLPDDPTDPRWAHLLVESARQAGHDRLDVLHESADGQALLDPSRLGPRRGAIDPGRAADLPTPVDAGDTIGLCVVDDARQGVSLVQSNASGWGSGLVVPGLRIFLHNRGRGFSLEEGHPAAYGPGRRPPHTLSPTLVTHTDGRIRAVLATMGADSQPQILLQLLARILLAGEDPGEAVAAGRFSLATPHGPDGLPTGDGFGTWSTSGRVAVHLEGQAPPGWSAGLTRLGHDVTTTDAWSGEYGHAHVIDVGDEMLVGGSDPRPRTGSVTGW